MAEYHSNFMGFSAPVLVSPNVTVKLLCYHKARLWTAEICTGTNSWPDYGPKSRKAAFDIAEKRAKEFLDSDLVDAIAAMCGYCREHAYWDRRQNNDGTLRSIFGWVQAVDPVTSAQASLERRDAAKAELQKLPQVADMVDILLELCEHCAWCEQNKMNYDGASTVDKTTGHAQGYWDDYKKEFHEIELSSYRLSFA